MTTIVTAVAGLLLVGATAVGVTHSLHDDAPRTPAGQSSVVLYGQQ